MTMKEKSENYKFFSHRECEYFPCHETADTDGFNCLFCYCPLYTLGDRCGGNFNYLDGGIKDCSKCLVPHRRDAYDRVMAKWSDIEALTRENRHK